jgi:CheY-like chemotaxis protein
VLLDLQLPDVTGYDVLRQLSSNEAQPAPPVIIVSATTITFADKLKLRPAAAIIPKSEVSQGQLRGVMARFVAPAGATQ